MIWNEIGQKGPGTNLINLLSLVAIGAEILQQRQIKIETKRIDYDSQNRNCPRLS